MAKSQSLLGYDITRFVPSIYVPMRQTAAYGGSHVAKIPGLNVGSSTTTWLASDTATLTSAENTRVTYDYNQLVNEAFLDGMKAFSSALGNYGMVYRQQAYNPPVDTLKSAKYVDIPEAEGESEYSLKRVASGAHLYGKNLVTSEVYTLGNVPFNVQPDVSAANGSSGSASLCALQGD